MKIKAYILTFFFSFLVCSILVLPVFSDDGYGNEITRVKVYQNGVTKYNAVFDAYLENENISISNYLWENFVFDITTDINTTVIGEQAQHIVNRYQAVGLQIIDGDYNTVYAIPLTPEPKYYLPELLPIETVNWVSETVNLTTFESFYYVNITLWHNYLADGNITNWELSYEWNINIKANNYNVVTDTSDNSFMDIFFWVFLLTLFISPMSFAGAIKMKNSKLIGVGLYSGFTCFVAFIVIIGLRF